MKSLAGLSALVAFSASALSAFAAPTASVSTVTATTVSTPATSSAPGAVCTSPQNFTSPDPTFNYTERYRPQFHFSSSTGWINDPNGLVAYNGSFHLFFQYEPTALHPVNIEWGHAISTDLIHWEELGVAISSEGQYNIYSGSAVIDYSNTAGFGADAMVAIYTATDKITNRQAQAIAYSTDAGRSFTKYNNGTPVLDINSTSFRDPKVTWEGDHWLMTAVLASEHKVTFYSSSDLKNWTHLSDFGPGGGPVGGEFECPDKTEFADPQNPEQNKTVLIINTNPGGLYGSSGTFYFVGDYNSTTGFTPDGKGPRWFDYGADSYATVTWNNLPASVAGPIALPWMNSWAYGQEIPTYPFRSSQAIPRRLTLRDVNGTNMLHQEPVCTLDKLTTAPYQELYGLSTDSAKSLNVSGKSLRIEAVLKLNNASTGGLNVRVGQNETTAIGYNTTSQEVYVDRRHSGVSCFNETFAAVHSAPFALEADGILKLQILVDWASVEVFASSTGAGQVVLTDLIFPDPSSQGIELFATGGGEVELISLKSSGIASIWTGDRANETGVECSYSDWW
ncbi:hypothetical protein JCM1841_005049 [Sporobolomyces salmonicolor]